MSTPSRRPGRRETIPYDCQTAHPAFLPLPRFLLALDLSPAACWIYALLLARVSLSQRNRWTDEDGRCYVIYPLSELAADAHCARSSVSRALDELTAHDLVERHRRALNRANRIFVRRPREEGPPGSLTQEEALALIRQMTAAQEADAPDGTA